MDLQSTIRAYQKVLKGYSFPQGNSFSEDFAIKRFLKKFQEPAQSGDLALRCFEEWVANDELPSLRNKRLPPEWYIARMHIHAAFADSHANEFRFPKGSEFMPTNGHNSLEARLCASNWTVTHDCFGAFSKLCYNHKGLRRAVRKRYNNWYISKNFDLSRKESDNLLWRQLRKPFDIFSWKLERCVTLVHGSRFASVPKNNETDRPINIEPFGNILVQSSIGLEIKGCLQSYFHVALDEVPDIHRRRITNLDDATIDLKSASDRISIDLCRFLLPKRIFTRLMQARSPFVLGLDGMFMPTNKISSMGNGFTFELMSLILTAISRVLDDKSSVFGDDIIIKANKAGKLIELLEAVGLKVNRDKSFIDGDFRESCGANYHAKEGYIESYDFLWPTSINDCIMILNKCFRLRKYPSFNALYHRLVRCTPPALHGGPCSSFEELDHMSLMTNWSEGSAVHSVLFPPFFVTPRVKEKVRLGSQERALLEPLHYDPKRFYIVQGFKFEEDLRSGTVVDLQHHRHWAKYEMYLSAGRRVKDVISGSGKWVSFQVLSSGATYFRRRSLMK